MEWDKESTCYFHDRVQSGESSMNSIFARGKLKAGAVFNSLDFNSSRTPLPSFEPKPRAEPKVVRPVLKAPQRLSGTFAELYCRQSKLPSRRYAEAMFWDCMPRRGLLIAPFVWVLWRKLFESDYELIEFIGEMSNVEAIRSEAERHPIPHSLRYIFGMRVSIKRMERIIERVVAKDRVMEANFRVTSDTTLPEGGLVADSAA